MVLIYTGRQVGLDPAPIGLFWAAANICWAAAFSKAKPTPGTGWHPSACGLWHGDPQWSEASAACPRSWELGSDFVPKTHPKSQRGKVRLVRVT